MHQTNEVIFDKFNINLLENNLSKENFFGDNIGFFARHLVYIIYEAERMFGVHISQEQLVEADIYSLESLSRVIFQSIQATPLHSSSL